MKRRIDVLREYQALGQRIDRAQRRQEEIRELVEAHGGTLTSPTLEARLVPRERQQVAGLKDFESAGLLPRVRALGLVRTIAYRVMILTERKKRNL